jgi:fucose 4-O-acetylase-like acetyltransferase
MLMGLACRVASLGGARDVRQLRGKSILTAVAACAAIAMLTPPLWTTWQPHWRAWWLESYINGVHTFGTPQPWLFPVFPWSAFAFAGLAAGFFLASDWARQKEVSTLALFAAGGAALIGFGIWLDARPLRLYAIYDFWHTSPNFFLVRAGVLLVILFAGYGWCRWGAGQRGFNPVIAMGKSSLLIYWVHIEFVYGGLSILPKRGVGIPTATLGLLTIIIAMTMLALARHRISRRAGEIFGYFRRTVRA